MTNGLSGFESKESSAPPARAANSVQAFAATIAGAKNRIDVAKDNPVDVVNALIKEIGYKPCDRRTLLSRGPQRRSATGKPATFTE